MEIKGPVGRFLRWLFLIWTTRIRFGIDYEGGFHVELESHFKASDLNRSAVDTRLAQLDEARESLLIVLSAVDELKSEAESNKKEVRSAMEQIQQLADQKASVEQQLNSVRQIAEADINVFKQLAGVPSRKQIAFERFVGFILGILASVVATVLIWLIGKFWVYYHH